MATLRDVKGFALTKQFIHEEIFPKYPEIKKKICEDSAALYIRQIFKPVNEFRKQEIIQMNKKSVYRKIEFLDVQLKTPGLNLSDDNQSLNDPAKADAPHNTNKQLADKIVSQNLQDNMEKVRQEILSVTKQVNEMIEHCDNKLDKVITNMHTKKNRGAPASKKILLK